MLIQSQTNTPTVFYKLSIIEAMRATSDLLGIKWFLGERPCLRHSDAINEPP